MTTDIKDRGCDSLVARVESLTQAVEELLDREEDEAPSLEDDSLLTSTQAAALLGIHRSLVSRLARAEYLPAIRRPSRGGGRGGRYLFEAQDLLGVINSGRLADMMYWAKNHPEMTPGEAFDMVSIEEAAENVGVNPRIVKTLAVNDQIRHAERFGKTTVHLGDLLAMYNEALEKRQG